MRYQNNDFDEIDNMLFDYFNENKDIPEDTKELLNNIEYKNKRTHFKFSKVAIILVALSTLTTGIVFAKDIVSFFKDIFGLNSININNESVVEAIENKDYIQNVDSNYILINSDYKIKIDYLMLDDLNLYLVFNLYSSNEINPDYRISISDLVIRNEENEIIYSDIEENTLSNLLTIKGSKKVNSDDTHEKRELMFFISNGYPQIKKLKINFTKLILYNDHDPSNDYITLDCNCNFDIELIEKFIDRNTYEFKNFQNTDDCTITKCISTETGTYIILKTTKPETSFDLVINNSVYKPSKHLLGISNDGTYDFLYQYNITKNSISINNQLKLQDFSGINLNITK